MSIPLRYVDRFLDRHGKARYYYRAPGRKRIPLPDRNDPDFKAAYDAAERGEAPAIMSVKAKGPAGSFDQLVLAYFNSVDFKKTKPSSQAVTRGILDTFCQEHGRKPVKALTRKIVGGLVAEKADTPAAANNLLKKLRALMGYAVRNDWRDDDPTHRVVRFKEGRGHHTWTDAELAAFEARWPVGTRERAAYAIALYTGQRRSDVARMRWTDYDERAGLIEVRQDKTDKDLTIPVHRELRAILDVWPRRHVMMLVTNRGASFSKESFGNWFAKSIASAGLPDRCVLHGLRKAAARRLAEAGCTTHQIASITGHESLEEIERYTKAAGQKNLAKAAMKRLEEQTVDTPFPNPNTGLGDRQIS